MCSITSTLDMVEASTTGVGERGELVTEVDAGEHGTGYQRRGYPRLWPIPIMAMPAVAAEPQEVPVASEVREQMIRVASRKMEGYHLEAEVDDAGDDAAGNPGAHQGTDGDQYQDGPIPWRRRRLPPVPGICNRGRA